MARICLFSFIVVSVCACSTEPNEDLRNWVNESDQQVAQGIEPLPEVAPYEGFTYVEDELFEPFKPRKLLEQNKKEGANKGPDLDRRKELLESYPLEQLTFVGTLERAKTSYALIKADSTIYRVTAGNYLGQNFGRIAAINETEVLLKESTQDSEGEWKENEAALQLLDELENKK
ncbi:MAG: pilus assembly protein PilP [Blastocatellia bacterium]|nr:pilus assembly protein PilP [Blastocatellia bacterium]